MTDGPKHYGRPVEPVPEDKAASVIDWLYDGGSLLEWCRNNGVNQSTVHRWTYKDADFAQAYAHARIAGAESKVDEAEYIARHQQVGETVTEEVDADGNVTMRKVVREDMLGHRKNLSETLLKTAACFAPKRFGSKVSLDHSGTVSLESLILASQKGSEAAS